MSTLYLRNVPDDVLARLKRLAVQEGLSVSAMAVRELAESTRRADNAALLGVLPDLDVPASEVLAALDEARAEKPALRSVIQGNIDTRLVRWAHG